jgi:sterol desaturase/sphingolipid hydroxylase (fatty acid hydroxylase superfamily)
VNRDFYSTMAQVLPVLLLALMWDSNYLQRLRKQARPLRRVDPAGVVFWTKPRVRVYSLFMTVVLITGIAVSLLVLGGMLADVSWLRGVLMVGLLLALLTLLVRIGSDIIGATRP